MKFCYSKLAMCVALAVSNTLSASYIRNDIDYQIYRDFAENKGKFTVGATNVALYDKQGKSLGNILNDIPMVDFSSADRNSAVATAVDVQYIASVAHNRGYTDVSFGGQGNNPDAHHFSYKIVKRNNIDSSWGGNSDYHLPRLNKLITEIEPIPMADAGNVIDPYLDKSRYPLFLRVGSGLQQYRDPNGQLSYIADPYHSLIAGSVEPTDYHSIGSMHTQSKLYTSLSSPLLTYGTPGDSGSPLYVFDTEQNRWEMLAVLTTYAGDYGNANGYALNRSDYLRYLQAQDLGVDIHNTAHDGVYFWQADGNQSTITQPNDKQLTLPIANDSIIDSNNELLSLDNGKNLNISGARATLLLQNDINQGAGAISVNAGVTVRSENDSTWQGAGLDIAKGKRVNWQVKNPEGDRLSKIGKGELWVNGTGENKGDISVGDGLVVLAQKADQFGKQQAFNSVGIVSGRPTVRLDADNQVNPNNIYFGFRGGRLDLNGHSLHFNRIQNVDDGARIINNNANKSATITVSHPNLYTTSDLKYADRVYADQDFYYWQKPNGGRDYFLMKDSSRPYYPTNQTSNNAWEYIGSDFSQALQIALDRKNTTILQNTFNGYLGENAPNKINGALNFTFTPTHSSAVMMLSGGSNLNGEITATGGSLLLNGTPVTHAYDKINIQDVVYENEWLDRHFSAQRLVAQNDAKVYVGRNVASLSSDLVLSDNATMQLGFEQGKSLNCYYSAYTGNTNCTQQAVLSAQNFANLPTTQILGDTTLTGNSRLRLGKAHLYGSIQAAKRSQLALSAYSEWTNTADSRVGNLSLEAGSVINLNQNFKNGIPNRFNSLLIEGDLTGYGQFNYLTNAANGNGDHIQVNGTTNGVFTLALKNSGKEPQKSSPLSLLTLNPQKDNQANVVLNQGYVDLGAYRYVLANINSDYRLFNPVKAFQEQNPDWVNSAEEALKQAVSQAEQQYQLVSQLTTQVSQAQQLQQTAVSTLATAEKNLQIAEQELAKLKWFNIFKKAKLKREIKNLNAEISSAQTKFTQTTNNLSSQEFALANAQQLASKTDKLVTELKLEAQTKNQEKQQSIQNICLSAGVSVTACQYFASAEGMDFSESLAQRNWTSMYANAALSELSAQAHSVLQIGRHLDNQLSQHNKNTTVWGSTDHQQTKHESHLYRPYKQTANLQQVGIETPLTTQFSLGAVLSHHNAKNDFDDYLNGKSRLNTISLYAKYHTATGLFISADTSYGKSKNDLEGEKFHRSYLALGLNAGYDLNWVGIQIQPSAGARFYRFNRANYTLLDAEIKTASQHFSSYHAGIKLSKTFGKHWKITPSVTIYYVDSNQNKLDVNVNGYNFTQRFGRHLHQSLSLSLQHQRWYAELSAGFMRGNEIKQQRFAGAKVSYSW